MNPQGIIRAVLDNNKPPLNWQSFVGQITSAIGSSESVQKIKFGRGAVGKLAVISVITVICIAGVGSRLAGDNAMLLAIAAIVFVTVVIVAAVICVVIKQPDMAVLEGAELVLYQHAKMEAKGIPNPEKELNPVPDPKILSLLSREDGEENS
jgi:hypothetical protein